ncbi:MAG: alpha/beta hydrolase [Aggregatilineales bacterium]
MFKYSALVICLFLSMMPIVAQQAAAEAVSYRSEVCTPPRLGDYTVDCGWLRVPEDRTNPDSRMIEIAVMKIHSTSDNPAPDPVIYLSGGPGGNVLSFAGVIVQGFFAPFLEHRDIILFDQRGTGQSKPSLACDNINAAAVEILSREQDPGTISALDAYLPECHQQLLDKDINPAMYNSATSAQDVQDLRRTLGYDEWNLLGISYGTRLALTILRDDDSGIRSVILDSVYPPEVDLYSPLVPNVLRALNVLFRDCAGDDACNSRYPDLEAQFWDVYTRLNETPQHIENITTPFGNVDLYLTGDRFFNWVFNWLYSIPDIEAIPRRIDALSQNLQSAGAVRAGLQEDFYTFSVSMGMYLSVQCAEEIRLMPPDAFDASLAAYPQLATYMAGNFTHNARLFDLCANWQSPPVNPIENDPVNSDIPVLLLAGEYDPVTPPAWAESSATTLSNSFYILFPATSHGVVRSHRCGQSVIEDFLQNPTARPDTRCVRTLTIPDFIIAP